MDAKQTLCALLGLLLFSCAAASDPMENEELFEGDIAGIDPYVLLDRNAVVDEAELWPGGVVYYEIDWKLRDVKDIIMEAIEEYESKTCLKFRPTTASTKDYVKFTIVGGCWSSVGRKGGEQEISLSEGCHDKVSAVHELGHAIGLWHEHSRSDRDDYLEILWDNIKPGSQHNFLKLRPWENNLLNEEFDYDSIMLYGEYAFAKDRSSMTMRPRKEGVVIGLINNKPGLSASDVRRVNKLYQCFGNQRPPPPDVPDFECNFEDGDMCGLVNHENNKNTEWKINKGDLGGRSGSYLSVNAADASFRKVRLVTPFFGAYGRKKACLKFDVYLQGDGAVALDVMVHSTKDSKLILKHEEKVEWETIKLDVDLSGDVKFSFDARTRKSDGDGIIALDNMRYSMKECD